MSRISSIKAGQIDSIVCNVKYGDIITFGQIAEQVFGKVKAASAIGEYLYTQRTRKNYPWWRVVNSGNHPVADASAIESLQSEGHILKNGRII